MLRIQPTNLEALNELADLTDQMEMDRAKKKSKTKNSKSNYVNGHCRQDSGGTEADFCDTGQDNNTPSKEIRDPCMQASTSSPERNPALHKAFAKRSLVPKSASFVASEVPKEMSFSAADLKRIRITPSPISLGSDILGLGPGVLRGVGGERFSYPGWERYVVKAA